MRNIHNLIIVDESGSMDCIRRQTVTGINETLQSIRQAQRSVPTIPQYVTLICFSSDGVRTLYDVAPALAALDIPQNMYEPNGCTPLYDAIGMGISAIRKKSEKEDSVIVTIITDGMENASREYNHRSIVSLIEKMKKEDWLFKFIGANIDVEEVGRDLGMDSCMRFEQSDAGTRMAFCCDKRAFSSIMNCISASPIGASMRETLEENECLDIYNKPEKTDEKS